MRGVRANDRPRISVGMLFTNDLHQHSHLSNSYCASDVLCKQDRQHEQLWVLLNQLQLGKKTMLAATCDMVWGQQCNRITGA